MELGDGVDVEDNQQPVVELVHPVRQRRPARVEVHRVGLARHSASLGQEVDAFLNGVKAA